MSRPHGDERHLVARLGLVEVLGRDEQRPALVAQPMELVPDPAAQERVDARRRLVEEEQRRIVDERAGQLESPLHPARQPAGATTAHVPQVDELEDLAGPPPARAPQHPEQRGDEVDVLADGQVRVQGERLRHVADPLAGLASKAARFLAKDRHRAARRRQGAGQQPDGRRLARAGRADDPEDDARRHGQRDAVDRELIRELDARVVDHDRGVADAGAALARSSVVVWVVKSGSPQRDGALGRARTSLRAGHLRATAWVGRRYLSRIAACNATGTRPPDRYGPAASGSAAPFADDHPHPARPVRGRDGRPRLRPCGGAALLHRCRPGITRRRTGRGFSYRTADGATIRDRAVLRRIKALAVPPAWTDVWICPDPAGHLQATGRDARGRKQYRYHARWRARRDDAKFERLIDFAKVLPRIRARCDADLGRPGLAREKVLAAVVRLLELTLIRVGNDEYARLNRSFGLTTLENRHATVEGTAIRFRFRGKSGQRHEVGLRDRRLAAVVRRCQDLPGQELFQYVGDDGDPARRRVGRRQRLPARDLGRGRHGQGFPDVGRDGAGLPSAARARTRATTSAPRGATSSRPSD